jgi:phosphohistidine phosphatase
MTMLYILRHAEAQSGTAGGDHERPLSAAGERAALVVGQYMRQQGLQPGLILCSGAARAQATCALVSSRLDLRPETTVTDELYSCTAADLQEKLRALGPDVPSALVIGHNPVLQQLAVSLVHDAEGDALERLNTDLPPGGLVGISFGEHGWRGALRHAGHLTFFVTPRMLV